VTPEEQGRAAFEAGLAANPYPDGRTREHREWIQGYRGGIAPESEIFVAKDSGVARVNGQDVIFVKGITRVSADSDLYKAHPQLFEPADAHYHIEQATAAPREQRAR
jgi:hypothetical protein